MGIKKTLASLVLGGALSLGIGNQAKANYQESFDNPNSLDEWITNDTNGFYHTTFEGDGVLGCEIQGWGKSAHIPIDYNNESFTLEWDSYIESFNGSNQLFFGIDTGNINPYPYAYGSYGRNIDYDRSDILMCHNGHGHGGSWNGEEHVGVWYHNKIEYVQNDAINLSVYEGKGNTSNLILSKGFDQSFSFFIGFEGYDVNRLMVGTPPFYVEDGTVTAYVDNINFQTIPEPATAGLMGLGLAGFFVSRKRKS